MILPSFSTNLPFYAQKTWQIPSQFIIWGDVWRFSGELSHLPWSLNSQPYLSRNVVPRRTNAKKALQNVGSHRKIKIFSASTYLSIGSYCHKRSPACSNYAAYFQLHRMIVVRGWQFCILFFRAMLKCYSCFLKVMNCTATLAKFAE